MIKVGIIGATGYAGGELVRILTGHREAEIKWYGSRSYIRGTQERLFDRAGDSARRGVSSEHRFVLLGAGRGRRNGARRIDLSQRGQRYACRRSAILRNGGSAAKQARQLRSDA